MSRRGAPAPERFWQKVAVVNGCWLWTARKNNKGYGVFNPEWNVRVYAHRWSYEQTNGPIPGGLEIDHLCRAPACVNPEHLEAVSHRENIMRSNAPTALNAQKTHCSNGHPFDSENTYIRANGVAAVPVTASGQPVVSTQYGEQPQPSASASPTT